MHDLELSNIIQSYRLLEVQVGCSRHDLDLAFEKQRKILQSNNKQGSQDKRERDLQVFIAKKQAYRFLSSHHNEIAAVIEVLDELSIGSITVSNGQCLPQGDRKT